jgi:peptide/nickel transport system permease protein
MTRFLARRMIEVLVLLVVMSFVIYGLIGLMPGDPIDLMLSADPTMKPEDAARLKALYGLDRPVVLRWLAWLQAALSGDFGYSRLFIKPTLDAIARPLGNTALLMSISFVLSLALAFPIGIAAARRPGSSTDTAINLACFAGISMPPFWLALLLILLFAVTLGWLPAGGVATVGDGSLLDRVRHLVLPVTTLTVASVAGYARFIRAALIETMRQDYVRTARAKGAPERRVLIAHALRNALNPVVTIVALSFGSLFSGALITETMFAYPGMGKLIYDAVMGNDYNLALAALMFATLLTLVANLAADIAYAALDPRISLG